MCNALFTAENEPFVGPSMEGGQKLRGWQQHLTGRAVTHSLGKDILVLVTSQKRRLPGVLCVEKAKEEKGNGE